MTRPEQQPRELEQNPEESFLSLRETEILVLVSQGLANKQIARELEININTVKSHVSSSLRKLSAFDRTEAAVIFTQTLSVLSQLDREFTFDEFQRTIFEVSRAKVNFQHASALSNLEKVLEEAEPRRKEMREREKFILFALQHDSEVTFGKISAVLGNPPGTIGKDISRLYKRYGIERKNWKIMRRQLVEKAKEAGEI